MLARTPLLVALVGLSTAACGGKPKPKPPAAATTSAPTAGPGAEAGAPAPTVADRPQARTRGGVDLEAALADTGEARERILAAARALAEDRADGVRRLVAEGSAARQTVLALLASDNFDELIGAMRVLAAAGDPSGARPDANDAVFALLDHEVGAVRDVAWQTASLVADGAALARLLPGLPRERKLAVVRLLAGWDGAPVEDALWALVTGDDAELAIEATLAASAPGKVASTKMAARMKELISAEREDHLRLALILHRRMPPAPDPLIKARVAPSTRAAIDRALQSKEEALVLEGVRATLALPPEEREPLLEQLVLDPRPAVRAVTAEVLGQHTTKARAKLVEKLLEDPEGDVRMAAIAARARFGSDDEKIAALSALLSEAHRGVRMAAAMSLAAPELVERTTATLVQQLEREDAEGDKAILGALASADKRAPLAALIQLVGDSDKTRAVAAHFALTTATGKDLGVDLAAWRAWLDERHPPPPPPPTPPAP